MTNVDPRLQAQLQAQGGMAPVGTDPGIAGLANGGGGTNVNVNLGSPYASNGDGFSQNGGIPSGGGVSQVPVSAGILELMANTNAMLAQITGGLVDFLKQVTGNNNINSVKDATTAQPNPGGGGSSGAESTDDAASAETQDSENPDETEGTDETDQPKDSTDSNADKPDGDQKRPSHKNLKSAFNDIYIQADQYYKDKEGRRSAPEHIGPEAILSIAKSQKWDEATKNYIITHIRELGDENGHKNDGYGLTKNDLRYLSEKAGQGEKFSFD